MADRFSKAKRRKIMANISSRETKPEILVRKFLFSKGFRYRKNVGSLCGSPDIVLSKYKTVIFIHGCFWHGHENCLKAKLPDTRRDFWRTKILKNMERDQRNKKILHNLGWKVIVIWQCEINNSTKIQQRLEQLITEIRDKLSSNL